MSKFPKRIDARLEIKITESPETDPKRIALERRMNRAGAVCVLSLIALAVVITILCNVYLCEFLVYLLIVLFLVSVISGSISWSARQALDGDWTMPWWMEQRLLAHPRHQRSKTRPCLLLCGLRCGRGFVFTACLGVP